MNRNLASWLAGLLFGFGLALSGMTHPQKVLGFLDVAGAWDASLLFVLGGAVGVTLVSFRFILRLGKPMLAERFIITKETHIDRPMIFGAILFGIGWGISGYCPGPAIALIASPNWELLAFLPAAILGAVAEKYFELHSQKRAMQARAAQPQQPAAQDNKPSGESPSEGSCG
ncbi:MAG TPA: YeeE/YedE family protein [Gallionella sp.]|nr:YeeE/YedE family protein [Gallionella sp.]